MTNATPTPTTTYLSADRIITPAGTIEGGWIAFEGSEITGVGQGQAPEGAEHCSGWLMPGFVDIHTHGGGGATVVGADVEGIRTFVEAHRRFGTTAIMASLVSGHQQQLVDDVTKLVEAAEAGLIEGIHLEGPWIAPEYKGAHDPTALRDPLPDEVEELFAAGKGFIKMVTIAPEWEHGIDCVRRCVTHGAIAAVGHTNATYDRVKEAIEAGASVATHLFNAMRPISHREPGPIVAMTEDDRMTVELICDGVHLHGATVDLARRASEGRVVLVTDAMTAAAGEDGDYMLGELAVKVVDGVARLVEGGAIAGSTLTMDKAVKFAVEQGNLSVEEASAAASATPARLIGIDGRTGSLEVGKTADVVHLDADLNLVTVWAKGERVG